MVVGEVISALPHPDADKLRVTQVNIGATDTLQIVCGAPNVRVGMKVPVATVGAILPTADGGDNNAGFHIKSNTSTNQFSIGVRINNGFYQEEGSNHSGSGILSRDINCIVNLVAGDYVEIFVENTYTGATIDGYSGKTYFEVKQIR